MTIHFNLHFEDLLAFQQDVIKNAHTHQIKEKYFKWITSILLFLAILLLMKLSFITVITSLILTIIYFIIFPLLYTRITYFKLKNKMQNNDYSHVLGDCEMTFSDAGIVRKLKGKTTHFDWDHFERLREDYHHYFLYVSDLQGLIIPKESDSINKEDKAAFHELIRRHAE